MRIAPTGAALLAAADTLLRQQLLPHLPEDQRQNGLMVARCLAIAARQLERGLAPLRAQLTSLQELLGEPVQTVPDTQLDAALDRAQQRLVVLLRQGEHSPTLHAHLLESARQAVLESNPRYLERP